MEGGVFGPKARLDEMQWSDEGQVFQRDLQRFCQLMQSVLGLGGNLGLGGILNAGSSLGSGFPQQLGQKPSFGAIQDPTMHVKTKMSGEKLYQIMSSITDPIAQAAFYNQAKGSGRGMNDLAAVVRDKRFGGDQVRMNQWINLHGSGGWAGEPNNSEQYGPAMLGCWDFATGEWRGGISGERTYKIPNWSTLIRQG
jgi:hypothetical protein